MANRTGTPSAQLISPKTSSGGVEQSLNLSLYTACRHIIAGRQDGVVMRKVNIPAAIEGRVDLKVPSIAQVTVYGIAAVDGDEAIGPAKLLLHSVKAFKHDYDPFSHIGAGVR